MKRIIATTLVSTSLVLCFCVTLTGCSAIRNMISAYSFDKHSAIINTENVTRFTFDGKSYTILDDTVTEQYLGEWIGYIRKTVAVDKNGSVLYQENAEDITLNDLADLTEKMPEAEYIIPFLNIYAPSTDENYLIVDAKGAYHKAVLSDKVSNADVVFNFKAN